MGDLTDSERQALAALLVEGEAMLCELRAIMRHPGCRCGRCAMIRADIATIEEDQRDTIEMLDLDPRMIGPAAGRA